MAWPVGVLANTTAVVKGSGLHLYLRYGEINSGGGIGEKSFQNKNCDIVQVMSQKAIRQDSPKEVL